MTVEMIAMIAAMIIVIAAVSAAFFALRSARICSVLETALRDSASPD